MVVAKFGMYRCQMAVGVHYLKNALVVFGCFKCVVLKGKTNNVKSNLKLGEDKVGVPLSDGC